MIKTRFSLAAAALALVAVATPTLAQRDPAYEAARKAGTVGEKMDGYLGVVGDADAGLRKLVDELNIKRRAAYTDLAAKRSVTVQDVAASIGCQTLSTRVQAGQIYKIGSGDWQVKGAGAIALPDYCAKGN